jgi:hypothetical protein
LDWAARKPARHDFHHSPGFTMTMPENRLKIGAAIIAVLLVANFIIHVIWNWGLVTIKVTNAPIGQVIRSIERQGWVTIYSNIDPQTKISMYVDHVTLPEAMVSLAANSDAQWHLGFFVAPTSAGVKEEIRTFTEDADRNNDSVSTYSFQTPLEMISDETTSIADPRLQVWPGFKLPPAPPPPPPDADGTADAAPAPEPEVAPTSVQGYLRAFAREADIWVMAPASWDPAVAIAPPASSSISGAIRHFVSGAHGSVTQALILRGRPPRLTGDGERRPRSGGGFRGAGMDMTMMEDRMDNAINGLPAAQRPAMRETLRTEVQFQKEVRQAPRELRRSMWMKHMADHQLGNDNGFRRSPEKRAQMYARLVSNRSAAQGK